MAKLRLYPHRTADVGVVWHPWWAENEGSRSWLPPVLKGWDYASELTVGVTVEIDESELLASTGLPDVRSMAVLVLADCALTQERFISKSTLVDCDLTSPVDVALALPPGRIAGDIRLTAHLALDQETPPVGERIAHMKGARLHASDPFRVLLEGDAGRFPTEPVSFREFSLKNAPWTVATQYDFLSDNFMGTVRLLINTDHPIGSLTLDPAMSSRLNGVLRADVLRLLIATTSREVLETDIDSLDEESVGQVLESMSQLFLRRSVKSAAQLYLENPVGFEQLLQEHLDPLSGVFG